MGCGISQVNKVSVVNPSAGRSTASVQKVRLTKVTRLTPEKNSTSKRNGTVSRSSATGKIASNQTLLTLPEESPLEEFKNGAGHKYFKEFPTPQLLEQAQREFFSKNYEISDDSKKKAPYPVQFWKKEVFKVGDYEEIDKHATSMPPNYSQKPVEELVDELLSVTSDVIGAVRVIFRWIAAQDVNRMEFTGAEPPDSVGYYFYRIQQGRGGYAELFKNMCHCANVPCSTVSGFVKGVGYEPGDDVTSHVGIWCAVFINGSWRFVDCQWGSSHVSVDGSGTSAPSKNQSCENEDRPVVDMTYAYEEFYFLTDPHHLIYTHFPYDDRWQLLARPLTIEEFQKMAYLKPSFFDLGFELTNYPQCNLVSENGTCEVSLKLPTTACRRFVYRLYYLSGNDSEHKYKETRFENYVFLEVLKETSVVQAKLYFPFTGKYKFKLFSRDTTKECKDFSSICSYVIYCEKAVSKIEFKPNPHNPRYEWGPGADTDALGIEAISHKSGRIEPDMGETEVRMRLSQKVEFLHKLLRHGEPESTYNSFIFHRYEKNELIIKVRLPRRGKYMLSLYAKLTAEEGSFPSVCNYLLECDAPAEDPSPFPTVHCGKVGPNQAFYDLGLSTLDSDSGFFECNESGELVIKFHMRDTVWLIPKLCLQIGDGYKELDGYVVCRRDAGAFTVHIVFPEPGVYQLILYGKKPSSSPGGYPPIYYAIVEANFPKVGAMPFPKVFSKWKDNYQLLEPTSGFLPTNENVRFLADIPDSSGVAVIGSTWTHLQRNDAGLWECNLETGSTECDLKFSACLDEDSGKYSCLQLFKVVSETTLKNIVEKQKQKYTDCIHKLKEKQGRRDRTDLKKGLVTEEELERRRQKQEERVRIKLEQLRMKEELELQTVKQQELMKKVAEEIQRRKETEENIIVTGDVVRKCSDGNTRGNETRPDDQIVDKTAKQGGPVEQKAAIPRTESEKQRTIEEALKFKASQDKLLDALQKKDRQLLEAVVKEFKAQKFTQKSTELDEAQRLLDQMALSAALTSAIENKDMMSIKRTMGHIESKGFADVLHENLAKARDKLKTLERVSKLRSSVLTMDANTMTEMRRYNNPPEIVHQVMIATLLILGEHEGITKKWKNCQKRCNPTGPDGLKKRVLEFDVDKLHPEIAARAGKILEEQDLDDVKIISAGAATFYVWSMGMVKEITQRLKDKGETVTPANKFRQKEIFLGRGDIHDDELDRPVSRVSMMRPTTTRSVRRPSISVQ